MSVELEAPIVSPENEGDEGKEKMASMLHGLICTNVITALETYLEENDIGYIFDSSTTFKLVNISRKRLPDVSFVSYDKLQEPPVEELTVIPDLVVEVVSTYDTFNEVDEKVEHYLKVGVRLIWVIDPVRLKVQVHKALSPIEVLYAERNGELDGEDVLPGFKLPLTRVFRRKRTPPQPPTP